MYATLLLLGVMLLGQSGQTVITPERKAAMAQSAQQISTYNGRTKQNDTQITGLQQSNARIAKEKAAFIAAEKKRLGLDDSWSWNDTGNDWVQLKK